MVKEWLRMGKRGIDHVENHVSEVFITEVLKASVL